MKILCALGKYQYGDPSRGIAPEYASFIPALKRLGHEVIHFELWNRRCHINYALLNKALLQTVYEKKPDVLLAVPLNYEIWMETLDIIRTHTNTATICWTTDDSWKYREVSRFIGHGFHGMTTTYVDALPKYHKDRIKNVLLTQWAANAETVKPPIPSEKCQYQVSFIGFAHGNRKKKVEQLRKRGIDITCFGYGWPAGPIPFSEIPEIMQNSIISLNFANSRGQNQIKARTFEVPGAGGFLLTESAAGLENFYEIGKEIDIFNGTTELVNKINYYLKNPEKRDAVALSGFERTKSEHTYDARMKDVVAFAIKSRDRYKKAKNIGQIPTSLDMAVEKHRMTRPLKFIRSTLVFLLTPIFGGKRGARAARRLIFEMSWRLFGMRTFSASGWPGIMFPDQ